MSEQVIAVGPANYNGDGKLADMPLVEMQFHGPPSEVSEHGHIAYLLGPHYARELGRKLIDTADAAEKEFESAALSGRNN